jgi:hypothetical protein
MNEITQKWKKKFGLSSTGECFPNPRMLLEFGVSLFTVSLWSTSPLESVLPPRAPWLLLRRDQPQVSLGIGMHGKLRSLTGQDRPEALSAVPGPALLGSGVGGQGVKGHGSPYPGLAGAGAARTGHKPGFLAERLRPSHLAAVCLFAPL